MSAFHRTFEVFEISCSQKEQNHSQRTRRITDDPSISTENNHLLEHPPSLTLDSAKIIESVTPDSRTPECGIHYCCTRQYPVITGVLLVKVVLLEILSLFDVDINYHDNNGP